MTKLTDQGWPRPIVNGLPIPWVSPPEDLSQMNGQRAEACASGAICAVCGLGYQDGEEAYVLVRAEAVPADLDGGYVIAMDNAVMHKRCAQLAMGVCPALLRMKDQGLLRIVRTTGNNATPTMRKDAKDGEKRLMARFDGCECTVVEEI